MPWLIESSSPPLPVPQAAPTPSTPVLPQFDAPFRLDSKGQAVTVEQGSPEDIAAQIYNVIACPQGAKQNDPTWGIPSPLFGPVPLDLNGIVKAVQALVPGATVEAVQRAVGNYSTVDVTLTATGGVQASN